jgi:upstream activation factor subunit UAF30
MAATMADSIPMAQTPDAHVSLSCFEAEGRISTSARPTASAPYLHARNPGVRRNPAGDLLAFPAMSTPKKPEKSTKKANPALLKPVQPDEVLAAVVGSKPIPRSEITKLLWDYIKKNGLQDQKVKTNINADDKLKAVFGGKTQVTMFEMTKLVSAHIKG